MRAAALWLNCLNAAVLGLTAMGFGRLQTAWPILATRAPLTIRPTATIGLVGGRHLRPVRRDTTGLAARRPQATRPIVRAGRRAQRCELIRTHR